MNVWGDVLMNVWGDVLTNVWGDVLMNVWGDVLMNVWGDVLMNVWGDVLMNERHPACTQQCKLVSAMQEVTPHIEEARRGGGVSDEARCH
jgi:hypothetical protein